MFIKAKKAIAAQLIRAASYFGEAPKEAQGAKNISNSWMRWYMSDLFNGEKNLGEVGPIKNYFLDTQALRSRSWQMYLESEQCQMAIKRLVLWVIGNGLHLQCVPETRTLKSEKIDLGDSETFTELIESRWETYAQDKMSDFANMRDLHTQAYSAAVNMLAGGDVLVICRIINGIPKVQLIDGAHVGNPQNIEFSPSGDAYYGGNIVRDGVEINEYGQHVAFHVQYTPFEWQRIEARNPKTGQIMAWMGSIRDFRLDDTRGMAELASVIESAAQLARYKTAMVGAAEEAAKIAMFFEYDLGSDGTPPILDGIAKITNFDAKDDVPVDVAGKQLAQNVVATTGKQAFNMVPGGKVSTVKNEQPLQFKEFHGTVSDDIFSAIGIPPDVARMIYNNSFSASRAALKDWEHTLQFLRMRFARFFYMPIYNLWLDCEVLRNKVQAPGYLRALQTNDEMVLSAYRRCIFVGTNVPHIDPEKEVRAERAKLGDAFANAPLTTVEAATRNVNGGDSQSNIEQVGRELKMMAKLKIPIQKQQPQQPAPQP